MMSEDVGGCGYGDGVSHHSSHFDSRPTVCFALVHFLHGRGFHYYGIQGLETISLNRLEKRQGLHQCWMSCNTGVEFDRTVALRRSQLDRRCSGRSGRGPQQH